MFAQGRIKLFYSFSEFRCFRKMFSKGQNVFLSRKILFYFIVYVYCSGLSLLYINRLVDEKLRESKDGILPQGFNLSLGVYVSQLKYQCAMLTERVCYECANLMGGAGVCDNTLMQDLMGLSRIQEIGAGTRQIQQYIMQYGLRKIFKML